MPLCGSTACGCSLSSSAATSAAINGYYPTIGASGAGTPASPWVMTLDTNWATEIADFVNFDATGGNLVIAGVTVGTTDGGGDLAISYGYTFATAPTVVVTVLRATAFQISGHFIAAPTTTGTTVRVTANDGVLASTSVSIHWIAVGL